VTLATFGTMFSGGEGAGVGLTAAGLAHRWGIEFDPDIAAVARANGFDVTVADVRAVDYAALEPVDWLHASPVCTRASVANSGATEAQEDIDTAAAVVRAIDAIRPQVFTLENVWQYRDFTAFRNICKALGEHGYFYDFEHVNCADFGVPQTRRRLILRASRGLLPWLPEPVPWVGWYEAIEDLIPTLPESKLAPWQLARLPEELRETVLVESKNANQERGKGYRDVFEPALTVVSDGKVSHAPKAMLFSSNGNNDSYGDHHADAGAPALSVTAQALGRARAVLIDTGNTSRDATLIGAESCAMTGQSWHGRRPSQAPLAVLVAGLLNSESTTLTQRDGGEPAFTVTTSHNQRDARACPGARVVSMTPRCLARFQSVPDWYELPTKRTLAAKVIGNMVPPLLMQRIAEGMKA
jgi:DNA (cytosine-5)-methyltransferase 1